MNEDNDMNASLTIKQIHQHYLHPDTVIRHYCQWIKVHSKGIGNVAEKPWNIEKFRKVYGNDTHKDILDEFLLLKEEFEKENNRK